jgi:septum formation protein
VTASAPALVLASTSKFRRALLDAAGVSYRAVSPEVEEIAPAGLSPRQLALHFAHLKAAAVARRFPAELVVGSDQTADLGGKLLRKPQSREEARRQLSALEGTTHFLHAAVALHRLTPKLRRGAVESVRLQMRRLTRKQIEAYLDTDEWEGCAGGYRIEGRGIQLFETVRGDYHAIVGLPLLRMLRMLRQAGLDTAA